MDDAWIEYIPWAYASIQGLITLIVSIIGAKYVRNEFLLQKSTVKQQTELAVNIDTENKTLKEANEQEIVQIEQKETEADPAEPTTNESEEFETMSKMGFCKLWFKIVWKMRGIYCSLGVHVFDVLTDVVVIFSWFTYPDISGDGIDPRAMAYSAIVALLFHKFVSVIALWAKEKSIIRCILQFFDLLIFQEIYLSHQRIITQLNNKSNTLSHNSKVLDEDESKSEQPIETTTTFKYVRNLEAIFESIPQAILQLVFIIRTGWQSEGSGIFFVLSIASIFQSITSMTNSILSNDNIYMTLPKWERHKQRLPPTWPFLKHFIARLSEVISRISLCALFWVVCGGLPFGIMILMEIIFLSVIIYIWDLAWDLYSDDERRTLSVDEICLRIQALIVMPSELVYELDSSKFTGFGDGQLFEPVESCGDCLFKNVWVGCLGTFCSICTCFAGPAAMISTCCFLRQYTYPYMTVRIGISMMEWILLILWPYMDQSKWDYLYSVDYGFVVFIISITCFLIFTQYQSLFPDFALPFNIPIRSHFGYAFNGELEELQRFTIPKPPRSTSFHWHSDPTKSELLSNSIEHSDVIKMVFFGQLPELMQLLEDTKDDFEFQRQNKLQSVDRKSQFGPLAVIALSNQQYSTQEWLEKEAGVRKVEEFWSEQYQFETMDYLFARYWLQPDYSIESNLWELSYPGAVRPTTGEPKILTVTPLMLALSNKQYHVVDWLVNEKKVKLPTVLFNNQSKYDAMDYKFAREYIEESGQDYWTTYDYVNLEWWPDFDCFGYC